METCGKCGSKLIPSDPLCPTCRRFAGYPNVRAVTIDEATGVLQQRYEDIFVEAQAKGYLTQVQDFENAVKKSSAVIAVDIAYLHTFLSDDKAMYVNYENLVAGGIRKPAEPLDESRRMAVEALLFARYSGKIIYAALSLDRIGLTSYGPYSITLKEVAIDERTTVLERNSYVFVEEHDLKPGQPVPSGFRALWENRHLLAVSKLGNKISFATLLDDYAKLLLYCEGDRKTDEFIEVHIYKSFDNGAVESVTGNSNGKKKSEAAMLEEVKDFLAQQNKEWIEA